MPEGLGPNQSEIQPEQPKKPEGFELKPNPENAAQVRFMQENSRPGGEQPWSTGRTVTNEAADAQIAAAMEKLKSQVSPELFAKVEQAAMKPDGDAFKDSVATELRAAIGEEAFNQFNADTTVSRPFTSFDRQGGSPTQTMSHGENPDRVVNIGRFTESATKYKGSSGENTPVIPPFPEVDAKAVSREQVQAAIDELAVSIQALDIEYAALNQTNYEAYAKKHQGFESRIQQAQQLYNALETQVASQQAEGNIFKKTALARTELTDLQTSLQTLKAKYNTLRPGNIFALPRTSQESTSVVPPVAEADNN